MIGCTSPRPEPSTCLTAVPGVLSGGQPGGAEESLCHGLTTMTPLLAFDVALLLVVCQVGSLEEQDLLSSRAEEVAQSIRYCQVCCKRGSSMPTMM